MRTAFTVWIDGDSCPRPVRAVIFRAAQRRGFGVSVVANRPIPVEEPATIVVVDPTETADEYIVSHVADHDLVITRDIPLAERLVTTGIACMNDRGTLFDAASIAERRSMRDAAEALRAAAGVPLGRRTFGKKETKAFADTFDRFLSKHLLLES